MMFEIFGFSSVIIPEVSVLCAALLLLVAGVCRKEEKGNVFAYISIVAIIVLALVIWHVARMNPGSEVALNGLFVSDRFTIFFKLLVLGASMGVLLISLDYSGKEKHLRFEYPVLILLSVAGMMVMISANDMMSLYMGLELQSLALYVLTSIERDSEKGAEAGLKYFMLGALSSGILLYGASLVYGFSGTTNFTVLAQAYGNPQVVKQLPPGLLLGVILVLVGLCFKLSAVPFHMWAPDVYEGAPKPVTAFFASAPKIAAVALFVRVAMHPFGGLAFQWEQVVMFVAVASMIVGAFGALRQSNIKRLMAYSSIAHMGFLLMGLAAAWMGGTKAVSGIQAVAIYSFIYVVMNIGTFACIILMKRGGVHVEKISDLSGLAKDHPLYAAALAALMLSMAGIPPLAGFFGKLFVFQAAIKAGLFSMVIIGVLTSVVGAYYYLRVVKVMYFDSLADAKLKQPLDGEISIAMRLVIGVTGVFNVAFCIFPTPLLEAAKAAAQSLL